MDRKFSARRLDVNTFAEEGARLEGDEPVATFERLAAETQGGPAEARVEWAATGELRNPKHIEPEVWVHLRADTVLPLTCQRCLQPVDVEVEVDRSFRFVSDESVAAAEDDESEEDVLAISRSFNLVELVEDELLMALPIAPRHETCPEPVKLSSGEEALEHLPAERKNPFAILGKLKVGKNGG